MEELLAEQGVTVVVATRDRPELLRRTIDSIQSQDYPGPVGIIIVFDRSEPDESLVIDDAHRGIKITTNVKTPGLAGARNSGMALTTTPWVAFCDDDDEWLPGKLTAQISGCIETGSKFSGTGTIIVYQDSEIERIAETNVTKQRLLESRLQSMPSSSFLGSTDLLWNELGGIDEKLPQSYAEDYDLILRAIDRTTFFVVPEPQLRVYWHGASFFFERWRVIDEALDYLVDKHPDFAQAPAGLARIRGQQAIAQAEIGDRGRSLRTVREIVGLNWKEPRSVLALMVCAGMPANWILKVLHKFGKGI